MSVGMTDLAARRSAAAHKAHATRRKAAEAFERVADFERRLVALESGNAGAVESRPRVIEIRQPNRKPVEIEGAAHPAFDEVLTLAAARENIFLPGPAGCGKTYLAGMAAKALGLDFDFYSCSAGMTEGDIFGRLIPAGENGQFIYVQTPFVRLYENGGVFLLDEVDAGDANVLLKMNAALDNGHCSIPARHTNPRARRHPDFICIAAANTFGRGADRAYCGRNELDEAFLDRFRAGTVAMDYDEAFERKLVAQVCGEFGKAADYGLYERLKGYRERARASRLERIVSMRFVLKAYKMAVGYGKSDAWVDGQLFAGWRRDEIAKVKGA